MSKKFSVKLELGFWVLIIIFIKITAKGIISIVYLNATDRISPFLD
jgi:hypothetical protein